MDNEEFLAEMKRRREAAEAGKSPASPNAPFMQGSTQQGADPATQKGLIGMLLKHGIASTPAQANQILLGVLAVAVVLTVWVVFF